jgi:hypothetical protein
MFENSSFASKPSFSRNPARRANLTSEKTKCRQIVDIPLSKLHHISGEGYVEEEEYGPYALRFRK